MVYDGLNQSRLTLSGIAHSNQHILSSDGMCGVLVLNSCRTVLVILLAVVVAGACLVSNSLLTDSPLVAFAQKYDNLDIKVETVADGLEVPWSIAWIPDGTALFTERAGHLRAIHEGVLQKDPLLSLDVMGVEGGLLGVAVDPSYSENGYIYLYYTYGGLFTSANKIVRYIHDEKGIYEDSTIIDGIPGGPFHDGGRIKFGPDDKLYITTGDAGRPDLSQDPNSLAGKILRINSDGTIPHDNPFAGSAVYSLGHRNPQGLDWDKFGNLVITEHGPSGEKGFAHDEINIIISGANYGWPIVIGDETHDGFNVPILHTGNETWAPAGAAFYNSDEIPQWTGKYFVATLRGAHLHMIDLDVENGAILSHQKLFDGEFGRLRDVAVGPDGNLYILTSNQDGRGDPQVGDDKILKISATSGVTNFAECVAGGNQERSHTIQCTQDNLLHSEMTVDELCSMVSEKNPIHVTTDSNNYKIGGKMLVKGCAYEGALPVINIKVQGPDGTKVAGSTTSSDKDGIFATEFVLEEKIIPVNGTYSVIANVDGQYHSTKTVVIPEFGIIALMMLGAGLILMLALQKWLPYKIRMAAQ